MMYPELKPSRRVTAKWLDRAFTPLRDYLERTMPGEMKDVLSYLQFMGYSEGRYYYRNPETKGYIVLDREGRTVRCDSYAFDVPSYEERELEQAVYNREERFIHPNVTRWLTRLSKREMCKFGEEVEWFLQSYWGPIVNYDFEDLKTSYPLGRKRTPYCLYMYPADFPTLTAMQFVGDEIVEQRCGRAAYRQYLWRQLELQSRGWHIITVTREMLGVHAEHFRRYLDKAIHTGLRR